MKHAAFAMLMISFVFLGCLGGQTPAPTPASTPTAPAASTPTPAVTQSPTATTSAAPTIAQTPSPAAASMLKGFSLSPKSFAAGDFTDFFEKAKEGGKVVTWAGDWNELGKEAGGPIVVAELSKQYGYEPVVLAQFFTQSSGQLLRPLDEANKKAYKDGAVAFASKYKPKYLGLGIEVNVLFEKSPSDFDAFAEFFSDVYDAVKTVSPNTKVFTTFELEKMKGLHGGLFGGENDGSKAEWEILDKFPKADLVAFSTYPGLIYKSPAEIPGDYYSEIKARTSKPVVFTEIGWHTAASPAGWEGSEVEQAEFVDKFFALSKGLRPEMSVWSFMYDPQTVEPFDTMGLFGRDGAQKQAWGKWIEGS